MKAFTHSGISAGSGSGEKRAEWLREILRINSDQLIGKPILPPQQIANIPKFVFKYVKC